MLLLAGFGNAFFQQATGVEAAVYYTPEVLEAAGFVDEVRGTTKSGPDAGPTPASFTATFPQGCTGQSASFWADLTPLSLEDSLLLATIGVGLVKTLVIFVPLLLMDRVGRRPLLIASNVGIAAGAKAARLS